MKKRAPKKMTQAERDLRWLFDKCHMSIVLKNSEMPEDDLPGSNLRRRVGKLRSIRRRYLGEK